MGKSETAVRCGIVLAAGKGMRLRPYIHRIRGDHLPKQFVRLQGVRSMLEQTVHRCEKLIDPERLFIVIDQSHIDYEEVQCQLSHHPEGCVVLQPENKDTGPGLLLPLMHLYKDYPESIVAVFPSDHFIKEENLFMRYVDLAYDRVAEDPSRIVLIGMEPNKPEGEYSYILPGEKIAGPSFSVLREVRRFVEKPQAATLAKLHREGGLWNTLVMVFHPERLLALVRTLHPRGYFGFLRIWRALGTPHEKEEIKAVYRDLKPFNFSRDFLQKLSIQHPSSFAVLPVQNVLWSDLGSEDRVNRIVHA